MNRIKFSFKKKGEESTATAGGWTIVIWEDGRGRNGLFAKYRWAAYGSGRNNPPDGEGAALGYQVARAQAIEFVDDSMRQSRRDELDAGTPALPTTLAIVKE